MPTFLSAAGRALAIFCTGLCTLSSGRAQGPPAPDQNVSQSVEAGDLYLEVFINDISTEMIGAFRQLADGGLSATPEELGEVGLKANTEVREPNGSVRLEDVPGLDYRIDAATQRLYVTIDDSARAAKIIDISPKATTDEEAQKPQSSYGAVLNYSLFAGTNDLMDGDVKPSRVSPAASMRASSAPMAR
jgi:outer membrane usher protein